MPVTLPWPKMPKQPSMNRCSTPSRSTCCAARKRTSACPIVTRRVFIARPWASVSPPGDDNLFARIELDAVRAVNMQVAKERALPTAERKEGKGLSDGHVDSRHTGLD